MGSANESVSVVRVEAITWELVEIFAHTAEYPTNRITDVVLAVAGWSVAMLLAGGAFPLLPY